MTCCFLLPTVEVGIPFTSFCARSSGNGICINVTFSGSTFKLDVESNKEFDPSSKLALWFSGSYTTHRQRKSLNLSKLIRIFYLDFSERQQKRPSLFPRGPQVPTNFEEGYTKVIEQTVTKMESFENAFESGYFLKRRLSNMLRCRVDGENGDV